MWNRGGSPLGSRRRSKARNLPEPGIAGQSTGPRSRIRCTSRIQVHSFKRIFQHRPSFGSGLQRDCTIREIAFDEFLSRAHNPPHGSLSQRGPRPNAPPEVDPRRSQLWRGGGSGISDRNVQPLTPHHPSTALLPGNAPLTVLVSGAFCFTTRHLAASAAICRVSEELREAACRRSSRAAADCDIPRRRRSTADTCPSPNRRSPTHSGSRG
jgi:hypothetical protein